MTPSQLNHELIMAFGFWIILNIVWCLFILFRVIFKNKGAVVFDGLMLGTWVILFVYVFLTKLM